MNNEAPRSRSRRRRLPLWPIALALGLVAFGVGLARLLELRLAAGDVFPPYSTLRTDALGTKALFAALGELPDVRAEQNFRPLKKLFAPPFTLGSAPTPAEDAAASKPSATTLFLLGLRPERWPFLFTGEELDELEDLARRGVRVVLTFGPTNREPTTRGLSELREEQAEEDRKRREERRSRETGDDRGGEESPAAATARRRRLPADAARRWGLDFYRVRVDAAGKPLRGHAPPPAVSLGTPAAPEVGTETLSWHSAVDLDLPDPTRRGAGADAAGGGVWRTLVSRNRGRAVIAARTFGEGSLVVATDSFFLSNEALRDERHPALLAAVVGPDARRVVFDERHFGLTDDPGMMTLARRYRLEGVLAALGLLAGLFLWKSASTLTPPRPEPVEAGAAAEGVAGREARAGFLALLRRSVPAGELIRTCLARWEAVHGRPVSADKLARAREIATAAATGRRPPPAETYRALREALR